MINIINHTLNMDLANKINMNSPINIKKNDTNSHKFIINLFNSSASHDLTGTTSRIYFKKPDGTKVFLSCVLDGSINNKLSVLLTTQALTAIGSVACEITIYGTEGEIQTSFTFNFNVLENIRDDIAIESTNDFTALTDALAVVTTIANKADKTYVDTNLDIVNMQLAHMTNLSTFLMFAPEIDDTARIQRAINTSKNITFEKGVTYNISAKITLNNVNNIIINGNGAIFNLNLIDTLFEITNCNNLHFKGFTLNENVLDVYYPLFHFINCNNSGVSACSYNGITSDLTKVSRCFANITTSSRYCYMSNNILKNISHVAAIGNNGDGDSPLIEIDGQPSIYCRIEDNFIDGFQQGISCRVRYNEMNWDNGLVCYLIKNNKFIHQNISNNLTIESIAIEVWGSGCVIEGNIIDNEGNTNKLRMAISTAGRGLFTLIRDNKIRGNYTYSAIEVALAPYTRVENNFIENNNYGIDLDSNPNINNISVSSNFDLLFPSDCCIVRGNHCKHSLRGISLPPTMNEDYGQKYSLIEGNFFIDCNEGIFNQGSYCMIKNNTFKDCTIRDLFLISETQRPLIIEGNMFANSKYSIKCENAENQGGHYIIQNNSFVGWSATSSIFLSCLRSYIKNNYFEQVGETNKVAILQKFITNINQNNAHVVNNNDCINCTLSLDQYVDGSVIGLVNNNKDAWYTLINFEEIKEGRRKLLPLLQIPAGGTWLQGDWFEYKDGGIVSGFKGAICTVGGVGGTWQKFGVLV